MRLETLWYESSPYVYGVGGFTAAQKVPTWLGVGSGLILMATATLIVYLRWKYRTRQRNSILKGPMRAKRRNY